MASIGQVGGALRELLFPLGLLLAIGNATASGEWEAQATSGLNLRAGPGRDQSIVTMLEPKTTVVVTEQQGEWYKGVSKGEPRTEGWVAGAYLATRALPQAAASHHAAPQEGETKAPERAIGHFQEKVQMPAMPPWGGAGLSAPAEKPEPLEKGKTGSNVSAGSSQIQESATVPVPGKSMEAPPPGVTAQTTVTPPEAAPVLFPAEQPPRRLSGLRMMLRQAVSVAAVIMSCLALVFACKAYLLAKECYRAMMRFQLRFQQTKEIAGKTAGE